MSDNPCPQKCTRGWFHILGTKTSPPKSVRCSACAKKAAKKYGRKVAKRG